MLGSGAVVHYDKLVIACGAEPRIWSGEGEHLGGVEYLRTASDCKRLRARVSTARHVAIIGAGFLGPEIAATLASGGKSVTLIGVHPRPAPVLGRSVGEAYKNHLTHLGVTLRLGVGAMALEGHELVKRVRLADASWVEADLVVIATGARVDAVWLALSGLPVLGNGIRCDQDRVVSGFHEITAAGDVADVRGESHGRGGVAEAWVDGEIAGATAVERTIVDVPQVRLPRRIISLRAFRVLSLGWPELAQGEVVVLSHVDGSPGLVAGLRSERVVSLTTINSPRPSAHFTSVLRQRGHRDLLSISR